jgi:hypothetical protein
MQFSNSLRRIPRASGAGRGSISSWIAANGQIPPCPAGLLPSCLPAAGLSGCDGCARCPYGMSQGGIVSGGYTYVDPSGAVITTQYPTGQTPNELEATSFLESTSPFFGLQWQWVLVIGIGAWLFLRKK